MFAGHRFFPLLSGALFWPTENTLLVADLHLEKMASFAANGQLLPPYDTGATLALLERDIRTSGARRLICLGDSFHRDEGATSLPARQRETVVRLTGETEWIWLAGNHDPSPHGLGGVCRRNMEISGITLSHEPSRGTRSQIAGHLHPAAKIRIRGRSSRAPCFAHDDRLLILPAYGISTGSLNILSDAFSGLFDRSALKVIMLGKSRLYPVATRYLA